MTELALMIELGFFTLTGSRYQMTLPSREVDVEAVWAAVLKIVETEDEECLVHPEHFISAMRRADAEEWVRRLSDMSEWHRCADQEMLLGVLNRSSQILDEISGLDRPPIWDHTKKKTPPWPRPSGF
jgi:hypothetical protein